MWLILPLLLHAQIQVDSVLTYNEFIDHVKLHHPMAKQAEIIESTGEAELLKSRGAFDPKLKGNLDQKYFESKEYYDIGKAEISLPTWFGIEVLGGYERNQGLFLNPENNVPNAGLWFAGLSIPIGKGLFIDDRRAELNKAKAILLQSKAERIFAMNQLVLEAGNAYWNWFEAYHQLSIYQEGVDIARIRFNAVKSAAALGDRPTIDTLEARIQLQNRLLMLRDAQLNFQNQTAQLTFYLWLDGKIPLDLNENTKAEALESLVTTDELLLPPMDSIVNNHPEIKITEAKRDRFEIERKLAVEQFKPQLDLNYKPITEAISGDVWSEYSVENYNWGVQFSFPIFLRKERGNFQKAKLKLQDTELDLIGKRQEVSIKVQQAYNAMLTTQSQIGIGRSAADNYAGLVRGEQTLFQGGESSLFLVNSRERSYISAQIKVIELLKKNELSKLKLQFAMGQM